MARTRAEFGLGKSRKDGSSLPNLERMSARARTPRRKPAPLPEPEPNPPNEPAGAAGMGETGGA